MDGIPLLIPPDDYSDAVVDISEATGISDAARIERALTTAIRYRLHRPQLRSEFGGVVDRYVEIQRSESNIADNSLQPLSLIAEYFNPTFFANTIDHRSIRVRNQSNIVIASSDEKPFHLSYWLYDTNDNPIEGIRTRLPIPLQPGDELTVPLQIKLPLPGIYRIDVLLVREHEKWFFENILLTRQLTVVDFPGASSPIEFGDHPGPFDIEIDLKESGNVFKRSIEFLKENSARELLALEIACGSDPLTLRFSVPGVKAIASDLALPQLLLGAAGRFGNNGIPDMFDFVCCNFDAPPFRGGAFDVIVIAAALHHMRDLVATLKMMKRLLNFGGAIVLVREPAKIAADDPTFLSELKNGFNEQQFVLAEYHEMYSRANIRPIYERIDFDCSYKAICVSQSD
ncbi:pimeloyl-CoA biosynthesis protein BioC [Burkholderiales bacterium GJ-E10]|nr:pimeloyl-CoA biosynthesis protein BioC [Burkholderiales bacterium GJ-E10]